MSIIVRKISAGSTFQDLGRKGFRHFGVPQSGAFDQYSAQICNSMLGNSEKATLIELVAPGAEFECLRTCTFAIFGAHVSLLINGLTVRNTNQPIEIQPGDRIEISNFQRGVRLYFGIRGGLHCPKVLGSSSGCPISVDDVLESDEELEVESKAANLESLELELPIRIQAVPNPEIEFDWTELQSVKVSHLSDRKGVRLVGEIPKHSLRHQSRPVCIGAVQWTPSGELIVIGPDGPTIGGYPWIGTVLRGSMNLLAQAAMQNEVWFVPTRWDTIDR